MYLSIVDIYSNFKGKEKKDFILYSPKGERLTLIADHGEALILENKTGKRFPANKSKVKEI